MRSCVTINTCLRGQAAHVHCALGYITVHSLQSYKSFTEVYCVISVPNFSPWSFTGVKEQSSPVYPVTFIRPNFVVCPWSIIPSSAFNSKWH